MDKRLYIECYCHDNEHRVVFTRYEDNWNDKEIYLSYYLSNHDSLLKRIWTAIKYVFGYRSRYGDFGSTILTEKTTQQLRDFLNEALNYWNEESKGDK